VNIDWLKLCELSLGKRFPCAVGSVVAKMESLWNCELKSKFVNSFFLNFHGISLPKQQTFFTLAFSTISSNVTISQAVLRLVSVSYCSHLNVLNFILFLILRHAIDFINCLEH